MTAREPIDTEAMLLLADHLDRIVPEYMRTYVAQMAHEDEPHLNEIAPQVAQAVRDLVAEWMPREAYDHSQKALGETLVELAEARIAEIRERRYSEIAPMMHAISIATLDKIWLVDEIERLQKDRDDWKNAAIANRDGWLDSAKTATERKDEIERLQRRVKELEVENEKLGCSCECCFSDRACPCAQVNAEYRV